MRCRATLIIDDRRALGWLTDDHPDSSGTVALVLDANLAKALRPEDLAPDHVIELHGGREQVKDVFLAAGDVGFTVVWPAGRGEN